MPELKAPKVEIKRWKVEVPDSDYELPVFGVEVVSEDHGGATESVGSERELEILLRGIEMGCGACGVYLPRVEIPRESSGTLKKKPPPTQEGDSSIPF